VAGGEVRCQALGEGCFVAGRAGKLFERQRHGVEVVAAHLSSKPDNGCRIETRREEHAHRHVGDKVIGDAVREHIPQVERGRLRVFRQDCRGIEIWGHGAWPIGIEPLRRSGRQRANTGKEGVRLGYAAEQEESRVPCRVGCRSDLAARLERLDLRSDAYRLAVVGDVKRLDAEGIAGEQQAAAAVVPEREGEHATQPRDHAHAVALIEMQQNLGVGLRSKDPALGFQFGAQGAEAVDFAVVGDPNQAIGCAPSSERSMIARRRWARPTRPSSANQAPSPSGPRAHGVGDARQFGSVDSRRPVSKGEDCDDPAHGALLPA